MALDLPKGTFVPRKSDEDEDVFDDQSTTFGGQTPWSKTSFTSGLTSCGSNTPDDRRYSDSPVGPVNLYQTLSTVDDTLPPNNFEQALDTEDYVKVSQAGKSHNEGDDFTLRAVLVGLLVGALLCFTNMYFGLQSGWVTMGSVQAAVMGYGFCRLFTPKDRPLSLKENVVSQTVSIATATMPLTGGFVGIIPALEMLDPPVVLDWSQQMLWCGALTYFGVFVAVPLRHQTILVEQLPFPSGTAAANLIDFLHSNRVEVASRTSVGSTNRGQPEKKDLESRQSSGINALLDSSQEIFSPQPPRRRSSILSTLSKDSMALRWLSLAISFGASFLLALLSFIWTSFSNLAVCTWIGLPMLSQWHWTLRPTLSYVGQGIIMGPRAVFSMLLGAVIAWAFLGPIARAAEWASGSVDSWKDGAQGWLLWVAIGLMVGEALSFALLSIFKEFRRKFANTENLNSEVEDQDQLIPTSWWVSGAFASLVVSTAITAPLFDIPSWQIVFAVLVSCLPAVVAVRALGQTDLNPVSGVGKLSQLLFAVVAPGHMVTNIVAGAVVEASAQQAGDLLQAFKTGHILNCPPRHQFFATLVGSTGSVFVTVGAFQLYRHIYGIPSPGFEAPVAHIWLKMAYLMKEGLHALPASALCFAVVAFFLGGFIPVLEHIGAAHDYRFRHYIPSGVAMGIGMYLTPDWTLPRVLGAVAAIVWEHADRKSYYNHHIMVASGFVIGEVAMSLIGLLVKLLQG